MEVEWVWMSGRGEFPTPVRVGVVRGKSGDPSVNGARGEAQRSAGRERKGPGGGGPRGVGGSGELGGWGWEGFQRWG